MKILKTIARTLLLLAVVAGLALGGLALVKNKKRQLSEAPKFGLRPRPVTVSTVEKGTLTRERDYLAVVEPERTARIAARVTAPVERVHCDEGDRVQAGAVLVELDGREMEHRIEAVAAQVEQARADLAGNRETIGALESSLRYFAAEAERYRNLADEEAVPASRAERAEEKRSEIRGKLNAAKKKSEAIRHRVSALQRQKAELETRLGYYTVTSPFDGVVTDRLADPGDMASPQKPLVEVEDRSALKLAFDVPQTDLPAVREGLSVRFSAGHADLEAEISLMYPSLNRARMMRAEVHLPADDGGSLSPGAYVPVTVVVDRHPDVALVPRSSLTESPGGEQHVFAVEDGRLAARPVEVLGYTNDHAGVRGVEPGARVVRNTFLGWARLSSGEKVEAVQ